MRYFPESQLYGATPETTDKTLRDLIRWVDECFKAKWLSGFETLFCSLDPTKLSEDILVGLLMFTHAGRDLLTPYRAQFVERAKPVLIAYMGEAEAKELTG